MARRRPNKDKYNQVKPKVSPITYIMLGLFIFSIFLTMILLIDSPKQKFYKEFRLAGLQSGYELELKKDHNFKAVSLKQLDKLIQKGEEIVVFIGAPSCPSCPKAVDQIQLIFDNVKGDGNDVSKKVKVIYYLELDAYEESFGLDGLSDFYKDYEITGAGQAPDLIAFKNKEVVKKYTKNTELNISEDEQLFRGINDFFKITSEKFELE